MGYVRGIKTLGVDNQSFDANELLEEEARRRAVDGFNERPILDREGNEIARVREYSEGLLALLLKVPSFTMRKPFSRKRCFYRFLHLPSALSAVWMCFRGVHHGGGQRGSLLYL
jgi:hypothetical protein